jgi:hypothetical protein
MDGTDTSSVFSLEIGNRRATATATAAEKPTECDAIAYDMVGRGTPATCLLLSLAQNKEKRGVLNSHHEQAPNCWRTVWRITGLSAKIVLSTMHLLLSRGNCD